jgi:hypothetical protein
MAAKKEEMKENAPATEELKVGEATGNTPTEE